MKLVAKLRDRYKDDLHLREIVSGSSISFLYRLAGMTIAYVFSLIVARNLGAETWGIYSLCLALVTFTSIFGRIGFDTALLKYNAELMASDEVGTLKSYNIFSFKVVFVSSAILTLIVFYNVDLIALKFFKKPYLEPYFRIAAFSIFPLTFSSLNSRALRGLKKIAKSVYLEFVSRYLYFLLAVIAGMFFFDELSVTGFLWIFVIICYLYFLQGLFWHFGEIRKSQSLKLKKEQMLTFVKVALPLLLASSMVYFKGWINILVIGVYLTEADVGVYNIALKLAALTSLPLTAINTIAAPKFAECEGKISELQKVVEKSTRLIFFTSLPILVGLILFSGFILQLFGEEFRAAQVALMFLTVGSFFNAISGSVGYFLQMTGRQVVFQNITLIVTSLAFVLSFILVPLLGINGAAISSLLTTLVWNFTMVIYIKRRTGILTLYYPEFIRRAFNPQKEK